MASPPASRPALEIDSTLGEIFDAISATITNLRGDPQLSEIYAPAPPLLTLAVPVALALAPAKAVPERLRPPGCRKTAAAASSACFSSRLMASVACLREVGGDLQIDPGATDTVGNLHGLEHLEDVGGSLGIVAGPRADGRAPILSLEGLSGLVTVGGASTKMAQRSTPPWSAPTSSRAMLLRGSSSIRRNSTSLMAGECDDFTRHSRPSPTVVG